jgi:hypothetical protein
MNFKKHSCILLAILLLVSNIGFAFNVHYCADKIESISIAPVFAENNSEETCCGVEEKESSCCKNKVVHFQKKSDGFDTKSFSFVSNSVFLTEEKTPIFINFSSNCSHCQIKNYYFEANAPPFFKLNCQFIFYD